MSAVKIFGATATWLAAILGAVGVAYWLALGARDAFLLIGTVAVLAFFGTFLPVLRSTHQRTP